MNFFERVSLFFREKTWLEKAADDVNSGYYRNGIIGHLKATRKASSVSVYIGLSFLLIFLVCVSLSVKFNFSRPLSSQEEFYMESYKMVHPDAVYNENNDIISIKNTPLFLSSLLFLPIAFFFFNLARMSLSYDNFSFICPHCLKRIILKNIQDFDCPFCKGEGLNYLNIVYGCNHCGENFTHLSCTHCNSDINLEASYDENKLKRRRYERVLNKS